MADRMTNRELRAQVQNRESQYRRELVTVATALLFGIFCLSLISYHPYDRTLLSYTSDEAIIANWCGAIGANLAALTFYFLGSAAYLLIVAIAVGLVGRWRRSRLAADDVEEVSRLSRVLRGLMWSGLVVGVAALAACYQLDLVSEVAGGLIGTTVYRFVAVLVGPVGGQLLLWAMPWLMISLLLHVPLLPLVKRPFVALGAYCVRGFVWCKQRMFKRAAAPQEPVSVAGAVKDVPDDEVFWHEVVGLTEAAAGADDATPGDELPVDQPVVETLTAEQLTLFAAITLRRSTQSIKIFSAVMAQLPNTVLSHNPFVGVDGNVAPYMAVVQAVTVPTPVAPKKRAAAPRAVDSSVYRLPDLALFNQPTATKTDETTAAQETGLNDQRARKVEEKLEHFGVNGKIVSIKPGPVVTLFEYKPEIDSKISKIIGLEDDLAMALTANSMRIIAPIPGKNAVGFEIANHTRRDVVVAQVLNNPAFQEAKAKLPLILGLDALGVPVVEDLTTMPHLLVGGATGSGKSVGLNVMVVSLLCKRSPDDLRLIMIDPKRLEFTPYANIPHLLFPIVTQPSRAASVLSWVVQEMEERYEAMAAVGVRSFDEYRKAFKGGQQEAAKAVRFDDDGQEKAVAAHRTAYLVVVIDELADLMMVAGKEVEEKIVRIAQMARAAGIHLVVATQRPSVDVVTGLIKVNFPSRISFRVSSKVDSRTILDQRGAEKLLGRGDMLYMHASSQDLRRVHGPYVSDAEIERLTNAIREQRAPQYLDLNEVLKQTAQRQEVTDQDDLYPQLLELVKATDEISISMIQRHYRIGFNRSARLIERLEMDGILAPAQGSKPRKVLR